jgi:hypothetical protein
MKKFAPVGFQITSIRPVIVGEFMTDLIVSLGKRLCMALRPPLSSFQCNAEIFHRSPRLCFIPQQVEFADG